MIMVTTKVAAPAAPAPVVVAAAAVVAEPVAEPAFVLSVDALTAVAESSGLQWVNSDASKIRAAQEAMAAEVRPVQAPRERAAAAKTEDGPLVMVETRKDLAQVKLPFEQQP
jgi:ribonuclease E